MESGDLERDAVVACVASSWIQAGTAMSYQDLADAMTQNQAAFSLINMQC